MIAAGQPFWIVALAGFVTNMRFLIYSASLRRFLEAYSLRRRAALGYFTGDFTFAMFMERANREGEFAYRDAWFLGACWFNWLMWQIASIVGIVAATAIPADWGLQFAGTLALLALAIPACLQWPTLAGAAVAAPVAVLARGLPLGLGLIVGIVAGIAAASWWMHWWRDANEYLPAARHYRHGARDVPDSRRTAARRQRFKPSPRVEAALRFAPVCALAALIAPEIVVRSGAVDLLLANPHLVAAVAATGIFLWKRSMVWCIGVGLLVLTAFRLGTGG